MSLDLPKDLVFFAREFCWNGTLHMEPKQGMIDGVQLNPRENRYLTADVVSRLSRLLYAEIKAKTLSYDVIVSIPTGGRPYAAALTKIIREVENREVPVLTLRKVGPRTRVRRFVCLPAIKQMPKGTQVLLVDDSLFWGHSIVRAHDALSVTGCVISGAAFICNLECEGQMVANRIIKRGGHIASVFTSTRLRQIREHDQAEAARRPHSGL